MENLDYMCAKYGGELAEIAKDENLLKKSLGVLQEDGLYAFIIYLEKEKKEIRERIEQFLRKEGIVRGEEDLKNQDKSRDIYTNLHRLLLLKSVIERMLVYAIYHMKAKAGEKK